MFFIVVFMNFAIEACLSEMNVFMFNKIIHTGLEANELYGWTAPCLISLNKKSTSKTKLQYYYKYCIHTMSIH